MGNVIVWDIETIPDLRGSPLPMVLKARAMRKFAPL
jgi:hypothetical protein